MPGMFDDIFAGENGVANTLLDVMGIHSTLKVVTDDNYHPETGDDLPDDFQEFEVRSSPPMAYNINEIDGSNILQGDMKIIISATEIKDLGLKKSDLERGMITTNGETFSIVNVKSYVSGNMNAAFELQVRK